jgi:hypothetical protein
MRIAACRYKKKRSVLREISFFAGKGFVRWEGRKEGKEGLVDGTSLT